MVYVKIYNKQAPELKFVYARGLFDCFYRVGVWSAFNGLTITGSHDCRETLARTMQRARAAGLTVEIFRFDDRSISIFP